LVSARSNLGLGTLMSRLVSVSKILAETLALLTILVHSTVSIQPAAQ